MDSRPSALVISPSTEGWFLPSLLVQAGWNCDVVSLCGVYSLSSHTRALYRAQASQELADLALRVYGEGSSYAWVIPACDDILGELCSRSLLDRRFLSLLPIEVAGARSHLFSKINLSRVLDRHALSTPRWSVVSGCPEALHQAEELGYPCFAKRDRSCGGRGTFFCQQPAELAAAAARFSGHPFLLQQAVVGELWSVEALFWHGQLRAFALSLVLDTIHPLGPSLGRRYGAEAGSIPGLLPLLEGLGPALSAHGWANISLVRDSAGGRLYCIEADLRPNAWIALDQYFGGDFAMAARDLLDSSSGSPRQCYLRPAGSSCTLNHFQRLVQIGAPEDQVRQAMSMLPGESQAFLDVLKSYGFYVPLD
jgi:hypothetical protein